MMKLNDLESQFLSQKWETYDKGIFENISEKKH